MTVAASKVRSASVRAALEEGARLRRRFVLGMLALVAVLLAASSVAMSVGAVPIPIRDVWSIVANHLLHGSNAADPSADSIVWQIRAPRVLLGAMAGAGLSVVGVAVQAMVRNPLADPYVMGVESGAAAGAALTIYLGRSVSSTSTLSPTAAAFIGALATLLIVFVLARRHGRVSSTRLLLVGVAMSYAWAGVTSFVLYATRDAAAQGAVLFWVMGGLGGAAWPKLPLAATIVVVAYVAIGLHARQLNVLAIGDDSASSLGINPDRLRARLLIICALLVAAIVSLVGPIGFVGLVVPHLARLLFGADHRRLIPGAVLVGATFLVVVDIVARTLFRPSELPIGVVTAVIGTPFFLWLLRRRDQVGDGAAE